MKSLRYPSIILAVMFVAIALGASRPEPAGAEPRRPVALLPLDNGQLLVANRIGSLTTINPEKGLVHEERALGKRLSDLTLLPGGRLLLADEGANELLVLSPSFEILNRISVGQEPVTLAREGTLVSVANLASHTLTLLDIGEIPRVKTTIKLPFAPRHQLLIPGKNRRIVADAFGGQLAVVETLKGTIESIRTLPASNIGGLALSHDGQELYVPHQLLSRLAQTTRDDIHWGNLLANYLRVIPLPSILNPQADLVLGSRLEPLGDFGHGTGDPGGVIATGPRAFAVVLGGVDEAALSLEKEGRLQYLKVGRRPTALVASPKGRHAYVANTLSDSISFLDLTTRSTLGEISLGPTRPLTAVERGERLFYDARLTHDRWFSCHSCHTDGHTTGQLADTLGDGDYGAPKRILSLRGVAATGPWAWNGSVTRLEDQVRRSVVSTMHGPALSPDQVSDLTAYLRSLTPPPPQIPATDPATERGQIVFNERGCVHCHQPPTYTSPKTYDVGFRDEAGRREYNPPSLRGVAQGVTFFHDGRAGSLEEVLGKYQHQLKEPLPEKEMRDLIHFLRSL